MVQHAARHVHETVCQAAVDRLAERIRLQPPGDAATPDEATARKQRQRLVLNGQTAWRQHDLLEED